MRNFTFAGVPGSPFVCLSKCLYGSLIKCTLLFLLLGGLPARLAAQDLQWAKRIGGTGSDYAQSIALDGSGNVYVVGNFSGTADFDPGSGVFNLGPATGSDVYFAKYNASGDLIWAKALIGGVTDNALGVAVSGSAVYITGTFAGVLDFDPGSGVVSRDGGTNTSYDIFIAKYSAADGSYAWVRTIGQPGASSSRGDGIAVDGSGNVYVTGSFSGSSVNFGNVSLAGGNTGFLAKYDSNNTPLWAKSITPGASGDGQHVAVPLPSPAGSINQPRQPSMIYTYASTPGVAACTIPVGQNPLEVARRTRVSGLRWMQRATCMPRALYLARVLISIPVVRRLPSPTVPMVPFT